MKTNLKSIKHKLKAVAVKKKLKINSYGIDLEKNAKKCPIFSKSCLFEPNSGTVSPRVKKRQKSTKSVASAALASNGTEIPL